MEVQGIISATQNIRDFNEDTAVMADKHKTVNPNFGSKQLVNRMKFVVGIFTDFPFSWQIPGKLFLRVEGPWEKT